MSAVEIGDPKLDAGLTVDYSQPADRRAPPAAAASPGQRRAGAPLDLWWRPQACARWAALGAAPCCSQLQEPALLLGSRGLTLRHGPQTVSL